MIFVILNKTVSVKIKQTITPLKEQDIHIVTGIKVSNLFSFIL